MSGMTDRPMATSGVWRRWCAIAAVAGGLGACGEDPPLGPPVRTPDDSSAVAGTSGQSEPDAGAGGSGAAPGPDNSERPPLLGGFDLPDGGAPDSQGDCTPGATRECVFDQLCSGVATCAADGRGFGACSCGSTPSDGSGGIVGAACRSDADCKGGATCITAAGNGWLGDRGPAGGYCTFSCVDDPACAAHDPWSRCVPLGPDDSLFCIRTCLSKDAEAGEAKCLNRPDLACVSTAADQVELIAAERQPGYCAPRCGSDEECPPGRFCHRQVGACTDVLSPGAPSGSRCELTSDCDGRQCVGRDGNDDGVGVCSALCVLGSASGCGYAHDSSRRDVGCVTPLVAAGRFSEGPGDLGLCQELCDVDTDCVQNATGFACRPLNETLAAFLGRSGACAPRPAAN